MKRNFDYSMEILALFLLAPIVTLASSKKGLFREFRDEKESILRILLKSKDYSSDFNQLISSLVKGDGYLASTIKKITNYDVEVLDAQPLKLTYSQLENYFRGKSFDVVGISAMTFTLIDAYKTAKLIKKIMHKTKVILGGTHVFGTN